MFAPHVKGHQKRWFDGRPRVTRTIYIPIELDAQLLRAREAWNVSFNEAATRLLQKGILFVLDEQATKPNEEVKNVTPA